MLKKLCLSFFLVTLISPTIPAAKDLLAPVFDLPIECTIGQDCFVAHYVDTEPGKPSGDYRCGPMSYNNHNGTDFRVRTLKDMEAGYPVLAAADGVVIRLRDGVEDRYFGAQSKSEQQKILKIAAGNGVMIRHKGNWRTYYIHMKKGSVSVRKGQKVRRGDILGYVGLSGKTDFPHLHFHVFKGKQTIDPYTGLAPNKGCGKGKASLWSESARAQLSYTTSFFINTGFSDSKPQDRRDLESGKKNQRELDPNAESLVFWSYYIGNQRGDTAQMTLYGPQGQRLKQSRSLPMTKTSQYNYYNIQINRPATGWKPGTYRGEVTLTRNGEVFKDSAKIVVR